MNLDDAWTECMEFWRWAAPLASSSCTIRDLKRLYFGMGCHEPVRSGYHFCEYAFARRGCVDCPGRMVNETFDCMDASRHHFHRPTEFLAWLEELYRIYQERTKI